MGPVVYTRGIGRTVGTNFTRPNDTTPYTAGDVVCDSTSAPTVLTFTGATRDRGGMGVLMTATALSSANQASLPDFQLFLFDTAPAAVNDNAAFAPSDAEMRALVQIIAFPRAAWLTANAGAAAAGNAVCNAQSLWLPFNTLGATGAAGATPGVNELFGVLVAKTAYTPVAQERFDFRLTVLD